MGEAVAWAATRLERAGVARPRLEAERLAAWATGRNRAALWAHLDEPGDPDALERFYSAVARRERREPFEYIVREVDFSGVRLFVDPRVFIPRPETELLVETLLGQDLPVGAAVADLGTGSGAIAVSLAVRRPDLRLFALERCAAAVEVARENARRHAVAGRIVFAEAEFAAAPAEWFGTMDAVVSNPPYVAAGEWEALEPEVRDHEPREALVAGPSGLESYRELAPVAWGLLREEGMLLLELGHQSEGGVREAVLRAGFGGIEVREDWHGIRRVLLARRGRVAS
jgi:release factor glutamine methyltransferase